MRVASAGSFILWAVISITIYGFKPRLYMMAIHLAMIALPGVIAALTIGCCSG